ncbi:MAG TPA: roadblock/LC7 domain-containing protein [Gemmatimonadales bacterium]|nr:roadblock/LC7 domain-containing protein [Gemmatimonadales bacterium]
MSSISVVESWTEGPLVRYVHSSSARLVVVMTPAGQVLAQHGFGRAVDLMAAAALGAAIMASSNALAEQVGEATFGALYHAGQKHGIHLAGCDTPRGKLIVLTVFGRETSIGLVQVFHDEFVTALKAAAPSDGPRQPILAADFENELNQSLATLFRR